MSEDMAKRIRELRRERGYTLEKIAKDVGVGKSTVRKWETGIIANMRRDKIAALAQSLNTTPAYLMGWDEESVSDDTKAIALAKDNLSRAVENNPDLPSGKRLEMLFDFSDFDHIVVCYNLGIDQTYLNQWMDHNDLPPIPVVDKFLGVFHIKPEDLLPAVELTIYRSESAEWYDSSSLSEIPSGFIPVPKMQRVPIIGTIACGDPITAEENIEGYADVPADRHVDFCLICEGDSMIDAGIKNGDVVYIRKQPKVENGQIAAVRIDNEATLKRVYFHGDTLILQPANANYPPLSFSGTELENVIIEGLAVGFTHWF